MLLRRKKLERTNLSNALENEVNTLRVISNSSRLFLNNKDYDKLVDIADSLDKYQKKLREKNA